MPKEPFKTYAAHRTYREIKALCAANGLELVDEGYRKRFEDHVVVRGGGCTVLYNTFNGRFSGTTPDGKKFFSSSDRYENEPWFQALLVFFYRDPIPAPTAAQVFKKAA